MVVGIGIDIIEIERIKEALSRGKFTEKVFSPEEIAYCEGKKTQKYASYAARFAAKEAFVKALGRGFRQGSLRDIAVINDHLGRPELFLAENYQQIIKDLQVKKIHVSLSHTKKLASAQVLLEE